MVEGDVVETQFVDEDQEVIDKEWEEFSKRFQHRSKQKRAQAFYPCPPPEEEEDVNFVRFFFRFFASLPLKISTENWNRSTQFGLYNQVGQKN